MGRKRSRHEFEEGSSRKQAKFERRKDEMLKGRQRELESLMKHHDDLVRELFHLENFYLLSYDPVEARHDNSAVFQQYAAKYDLVSSASIVETSPTKTRKTRSGLNELMSRLTTPIKTPIRLEVATKKQSPRTNGSTPSLRHSTVLREPPSSPLQSKGRVAIGTESTPPPLAMRNKSQAAARKRPDIGSPVSPSKSTRRTSALNERQSPVPGPSPPKKRRIEVPQPDRALRTRPPPGSVPPLKGTPVTYAKQQVEEPIASSSKLRVKFENLTPSKKVLKPKRKERERPPVSSESSEEEIVEDELPPLPPNFPRKMKIYQRPAPFFVTNPSQRALDHLMPAKAAMKAKPGPQKMKPPDLPPSSTPLRPPPSNAIGSHGRKPGPVVPKFYFSAPAFLASYHLLDFADAPESSAFLKGERSVDELEKIAEQEATLRERIAVLQREGRLPKSSQALHAFIASSHSRKDGSLVGPAQEPEAGETIRSRILKDISSFSSTRVGQYKSTRDSVTKRIHKAVLAHFTTAKASEEKRQKEEIKRMKYLAKYVGKVVEAEWKKAVYHVKGKFAAVTKAEEARLGQIALDEVIEKSGKLLGVQRGGIIQAHLGGENSEEEESSSESTDEDSQAGEEDPNITMGSHMLLGDVTLDDLAPYIEEEQEEEEDSDGHEDHEQDDEEHVDEDDDELAVETHITQDDEQSDREMDEDGQQSMDFGSRAMSLSSSVNAEEPDENEDEEHDVPPEDRIEEDSDHEDEEEEATEEREIESPQRERSKDEDAPSPGGADADSTKEQTASQQDDSDASEDESEQEGDQGSEAGRKSKSLSPKASLASVLNGEDSKMPDATAALPFANGGENDAAGEEHAETTGEAAGENEEISTDTDEPEGVEGRQSYDDVPEHLRMYAAAVVDYDPTAKVESPVLLHGTLRPYQQAGLEWLATLHTNNLNGILADEMGLGKTIQTISLLAHLACDRGIWGPHLVVVPTSVILNWEMEFKKFLPGFRVLSYHGNTKRRKELRVGWNNRHAFNVCVTSYTLASRDAHIFKRKPWYYFILDEAHMIKNFKSQRWNILLSFRSYRRLLLTGTPLQNNLTELWSLLRFLMSDSDFVDLKEFGDWFANPLEKAIEVSTTLDDEMMQRVNKLHTVLRPYLLRRLKIDVEKELPNKYEHVVMCRLSKRQRYLYDEFMQRAQTREALASGVYQKVANILMQLRKVCNHPNLFEVRPIVTSFAMERSAIADFETQDLLIRRRLFESYDHFSHLSLPSMRHLGLLYTDGLYTSLIAAQAIRHLDETDTLPSEELPSGEPPDDTRSIEGFRRRRAYCLHLELVASQKQRRYLNGIRCRRSPVLGLEYIRTVRSLYKPLVPYSSLNLRTEDHLDTPTMVSKAILDFTARSKQMDDYIAHFAFVTPAVVAKDLPRITLGAAEEVVEEYASKHPDFDIALHPLAVRLQIAFPDSSLLEYDCGKLQELARLLRERRMGGHRVLIFTQMTRILDILEIFLNLHGWLYLRLDGATKIEDRQYVTERFNADTRVFAFIASSRSGGVGVNLTGADTVIFYDSDFNPQMDRQCEDRAHRIGQIRDVHIYRFISEHTIEESIFRKANQKRSLDDIVIQKGEFDWRTIFEETAAGDGGAEVLLNPLLSRALEEEEEEEDARAARIAAREEAVIAGEEKAEFEEVVPAHGAEVAATTAATVIGKTTSETRTPAIGTPKTPLVRFEFEDGSLPPDHDQYHDQDQDQDQAQHGPDDEQQQPEEEGGSVVDYMLKWVEGDWEFFVGWKL